MNHFCAQETSPVMDTENLNWEKKEASSYKVRYTKSFVGIKILIHQDVLRIVL